MAATIDKLTREARAKVIQAMDIMAELPDTHRTEDFREAGKFLLIARKALDKCLDEG